MSFFLFVDCRYIVLVVYVKFKLFGVRSIFKVKGFSMHLKLGIYFISCLLEITLQEMILKPDDLKARAIKDAPKHWFIFVIKLLDTSIKKSSLHGCYIFTMVKCTYISRESSYII